MLLRCMVGLYHHQLNIQLCQGAQMNTRFHRIAFAMLLGLSYAAWSADIQVDTTADENDGSCQDGDCSLRDAVAVAESGDRILVPAGQFKVSSNPIAPLVSVEIVGVGPQLTIIDGDGSTGVISIDGFESTESELRVNLSKLTVTNGVASRGGGIRYRNAVGRISDCVVRNSAGFNGGGVTADSISEVIIERCAILDNLADGNSGAGVLVNTSSVLIIDSTISGNDAPSSGRVGGGIAVFGDKDFALATLVVRNSTIFGNSAAGEGGGIFLSEDGSTVEISNSVIANNSGGDCSMAMSSLGWNLDSDGSCGLTSTGDLPSSDPDLGSLALNGGATLNFLPNPTSPLIDAGNPAAPDGGTSSCTALDQRGLIIAANDICDIGAVESDGADLPVFSDRFEG